MDDEILEAVSTELGISFDAAERFLESESGCYANIDGTNVWMSGQLIARLLEAVK